MSVKKKGNKMTYEKNTKVLAYHGQMIYEAKILNSKRNKKNDEMYYIHYQGWNKRWDEWCPIKRILPLNESNIAIMNETRLEYQNINTNNNITNIINNNDNINNNINDDNKENNNNKHNKKKRKNNDNNINKPNKKRRINKNKNNDLNNNTIQINNNNNNSEKNINNNSNNIKNNSFKLSSKYINNNNNSNDNISLNDGNNNDDDNKFEIILPTELKKKLINDWENITKHHKLMTLPRNNGERVIDILNDYKDYAIKNGEQSNIITEIVRGLRDYFDQALEVTLLYRIERKQYKDLLIKYNNNSMDQIYGCEHLCRLFVKLPTLLVTNDLDIVTIQVLKRKINDIIKFILNNDSKYFTNNYYNTQPK